MASPKTIVITTIQAKPGIAVSRPTEGSAFNMEMVPGSLSSENSGPRKRKRLTHLSPEERLMRRKLKNRVAAQTARDRKRVKMDDLEDAVAALEAANQKLRLENNTLRHQTGSLTSENNVLRTKLGMPAENVVVTRKDLSSLESAALMPLPKDRMGVLFQLMTHSLAFLMTLTICYKNSSVKSMKKPVKRLTAPMKQRPLKTQIRSTWWGPQQRSWNPSMNL